MRCAPFRIVRGCLRYLRRFGDACGRNLDCLSPQALAEDPKHSEFRTLDRDRRAVEANQLLDHAAPDEFGMKPGRPLRQDRQPEADCQPAKNKVRRIVEQDRSPGFGVRSKRGFEERLRQNY